MTARIFWGTPTCYESCGPLVEGTRDFVLLSDYRALAAELAKMVKARELSAIASATLRDESIAKNDRIRSLEAALTDGLNIARSAPTSGDLAPQWRRYMNAWGERVTSLTTPLETFVEPVKVHYSANDYEGLAVALADLLKQVNKFCEESGEGDFYTGCALAALGMSDNEIHVKTLNDLRSQANRSSVK